MPRRAHLAEEALGLAQLSLLLVGIALERGALRSDFAEMQRLGIA